MTKKYCYLDPDFPKDAFFCMARWKFQNDKIANFYLNQIYTDLSETRKDLKKISIYVNKNPDWQMEEIAGLIPVSFSKLYPLKRKFWEKPSLTYKVEERRVNLSNAVDKPELYNLLVTPGKYAVKQKKWYLTAAVAFLKSASLQMMENFMLYSNWPVDIKAKNAAIYEIHKFLLLNWQTGEKIFPEQLDDKN